MKSKKITIASILSILLSLFTIGFNGLLCFITYIFVGIGDSLSGTQNNNLEVKIFLIVLVALVVVSMFNFILSIILLVKNIKHTLSKSFILICVIALAILAIVNIVGIIFTTSSMGVIVYIACALVSALLIILLFVAMAIDFKDEKKNSLV